jgi:hypothetical protein
MQYGLARSRAIYRESIRSVQAGGDSWRADLQLGRATPVS